MTRPSPAIPRYALLATALLMIAAAPAATAATAPSLPADLQPVCDEANDALSPYFGFLLACPETQPRGPNAGCWERVRGPCVARGAVTDAADAVLPP